MATKKKDTWWVNKTASGSGWGDIVATSRDKAVDAGRAAFPGSDFYVARRGPKLIPDPDVAANLAERVEDDIRGLLEDVGGDGAAEAFDPSLPMQKDLGKRLAAATASWLRKHKLTPVPWYTLELVEQIPPPSPPASPEEPCMPPVIKFLNTPAQTSYVVQPGDAIIEVDTVLVNPADVVHVYVPQPSVFGVGFLTIKRADSVVPIEGGGVVGGSEVQVEGEDSSVHLDLSTIYSLQFDGSVITLYSNGSTSWRVVSSYAIREIPFNPEG